MSVSYSNISSLAQDITAKIAKVDGRLERIAIGLEKRYGAVDGKKRDDLLADQSELTDHRAVLVAELAIVSA